MKIIEYILLFGVVALFWLVILFFGWVFYITIRDEIAFNNRQRNKSGIKKGL